jgi:hypothetical protein
MLTGQYDFDSAKLYPELNGRAAADGVSKAVTQCAHIFSETAQEGEQKVCLCAFLCDAGADGVFKTDYATSAMAILRVFGLDAKAESLVGNNVHKHFNIFTMRSDLHYVFDHLGFWLEEVIREASKLPSVYL